MKKSLLVLIALFVAGFMASAQVTDTIVSTTPSNKNVVLEEYTGVNCTWCPDGHKRANQLKASHPGRVCLINIHQGSFAANTYTTQFGNALANQTGLDGYPAGTVNRHVFSGSVTALGRGDWASAANTILNQSSPVNIGAEATIDWNTRTLNVRVQLYYTAAQTVTSNALNVAIMQDNVLGPQVGKEKNPDQVVGDQYMHMHMLRHLITGQWGETIDNLAVGNLVEKNYEYVIPEQLGSPNAIDALLEDLTVVAFVCEGHQEVLTGIEVPIQHNNVPAIGGRILRVIDNGDLSCANTASTSFDFRNLGSSAITGLNYSYTVNGTAFTGSWTGNIAPKASAIITMPAITINLNQNNTVQVEVTSIDGTNVTTSPKSLTFKKSVYTGGGNMVFNLKTDNYGSETTFKIFGPDGAVVLSGGPFSNTSTVHTFAFNPPTVGCYRLEVYDQYGDGINSGYGSGYFEMLNGDGTRIFRDNGNFGSQATYLIDVDVPAGIEEVTMENTTVYPNPATDVLTINSGSQVQRVEIFNIQGQLVKAEAGDVHTISVKDLANGLYTLKLTTENGTSMHKIIKK